jgi:hypothetical protein
VEFLKKGRRTYGAYIEIPKGLVYCAFRSPGDFFKNTRRDAAHHLASYLADGTAAWAIDEDHLLSAKRRGCIYIAVYVKKLKWAFITPLETYLDPKKYYRRNYSSRGGSEQRYVSIQHFVQRNMDITIGPVSRH